MLERLRRTNPKQFNFKFSNTESIDLPTFFKRIKCLSSDVVKHDDIFRFRRK